MFFIFISVLFVSVDWEFRSRLMPQVIATTGIIFCLVLCFIHLFVSRDFVSVLKGQTTKDKVTGTIEKPLNDVNTVHMDLVTDFGTLSQSTIRFRSAIYFGWCFIYLFLGALVGLLPAMFLFLLGYLKIDSKEKWFTVLLITFSMWILAYILFHQVLQVAWPQSIIGDILPILRTNANFSFF